MDQIQHDKIKAKLAKIKALAELDKACEEIRKLGRMNDVDRCLICGEIIPEGSQVCTACRNKYDIVTGETEEMAQELRDIADVLKITEGTDTNIRKSMESILRIADRLERTSNGKKRR